MEDDDQQSLNSNLSNGAKVVRPTSVNYHGKTGSPMKATSAMETSPTTAASKSFYNSRSKPSSIKKGRGGTANYEDQQQFSAVSASKGDKGNRSVTVVSRGNQQQHPSNPYR